MKIIFDNHKFVDKISGIVSFYYLRYLENNLRNNFLLTDNEKLPFIILLGDNHSDSRYTCSRCECNNTECCVEIYKDDFFKFMSEIVPENDTSVQCSVYIESMDSLTSYSDIQDNIDQYKQMFKKDFEMYVNDYDKSILNKTEFNFKGCLVTSPKIKSIYTELCQTPNLNWNYGDPRSADMNTNDYIFEALTARCWFPNLFGRINKIISDTRVDMKKLKDFLFEIVSLVGSYDNFYTYCTQLSLLYDINNISEYFVRLLNNDLFKSMISSQIPDNKRDAWGVYLNNFFINTFMPMFFKRINSDLSENLQYRIDIVNRLKTVSTFFLAIRNYIIYDIDCSEFILDFLRGNEGDIYMTNFYDNLPLWHIHTIYTSWIFDIHVLAKICNSESQLCIIHCGDEHCNSIAEIFRKTFNYITDIPITPIISEGLPNRCVELSKYNSINNTDINIHDVLFKKF